MSFFIISWPSITCKGRSPGGSQILKTVDLLDKRLFLLMLDVGVCVGCDIVARFGDLRVLARVVRHSR